MAKKLVSYVPCFEGCVPERVHNRECEFLVTYSGGCERLYRGRVSSVSALVRALRQRLLSDSSIFCVVVYTPSGYVVCEVAWHYRG